MQRLACCARKDAEEVVTMTKTLERASMQGAASSQLKSQN